MRTSTLLFAACSILFAANHVSSEDCLDRTKTSSTNCSQHVEGKSGFGPGKQEWGYVKVRPYANMFWWLYYTTSSNVSDVHDRPLIIWLQGGPGSSATGYGNFEEIGLLDSDLKPRNSSWVKDYNVLFIDNPIGSGYSHADSSSGFAKNNSQIASDLLECMKGFLKKLPKFASVPTYIVAQSYGGKMAVEFALVWDKAQKSGDIDSDLRGLALGDPWISPIDSVLSWASYLYQTGNVDIDGFNMINAAAQKTKQAVDMKEWKIAEQLFEYTEDRIIEVIGNIDFNNILYKTSWRQNNPDGRSAILDKLMNGKVKETLRVNATWGAQSVMVFDMLAEDFMKPATDKVERLLNETDIKVFVYSGQLDLIVATPGTLVWVENLKWRYSTEWHKAFRVPLVVDNVIEGYFKAFRNFGMYWINRAGHMVPRDNPAATAKILKHLVEKTNT